MSHELGVDDLDQLLSRTRQALEAARSGGAADDEDVRGEGADSDGLVRVEVAAGGRIERIAVDRRAMRLGSHELADHVVTAVNAALDDLDTKAAERGAFGGLDAAEMAARAQEIQNASMRQLQTYTASLRDLMNSFDRD
ncbi:MAG: YbaB/EbfC family nucleoid-associated protein [Actinomadura sp.]